MKFNPFRPGSIVAPGMFVGRVEELHTIEQCLFQTSRGNPQHFLVLGERGIGKSSLLMLAEAIGNGEVLPLQTSTRMSFIAISVDMGGVSSQLDIVRTIGRELKAVLESRDEIKAKAAKVWDFLTKWEVLGVRYHSEFERGIDADNERDNLAERVIQCLDSTKGVIEGMFILIDESDRPDASAKLGEFLKLLTERLTKRGCDNVVFGLAGLPSVITRLKESHESSARLFEVLTLEPLSDPERARVINTGLEEAHAKNEVETTITKDALDLICELSEGYPHFIQRFAYSAFSEDSDNMIDSEDVKKGAYKENGALAQLGVKYFNEMYYSKVWSEEYRKVLNAMAQHSDGWVSRRDIIKESGVTESNVTNALAALKERKIIMTEDGRRGYYRLPTKSFAAWINAFRSVKADFELSTDAELPF
jgi:hypothetical protein